MKNLVSVWEALRGYKTYMVAALVAIFTFAKLVGWVTSEEFQALMGLLGAAGLFTLRDAIKKLE